MTESRVMSAAVLILGITLGSSCRSRGSTEDLEFDAYPMDRQPCGPADARARVVYHLKAVDSAPGGLVHEISNCRTRPIWLNVRFRSQGRPCIRGSEELVQVVRSLDGREAPRTDYIDGCSQIRPHVEQPPYRLVGPGETVRTVGWKFSGYQVQPGERYRIAFTFEDREKMPPDAPPGAELFRGPLQSNEIEMIAERR